MSLSSDFWSKAQEEKISSEDLGKEIYSLVSKMVNIMANHDMQNAFVKEALYDHRALQDNLFRYVIMPIIKGESEAFVSDRFDLRNEFVVKTCNEIAELMKTGKITPWF